MRSWFLSLIALVQVAAAAEPAVKWPWEGVVTVKAFGYDGGKAQPIVKEGRMDPSAEPPEGVTLDARQMELASRAIHHIPAESLPLYMCYEPRDALVFYDKDGGIVGSISICFSCFRTDSMRINFALMAELFAPLKLRRGYAFKDGEPKAIQEKYNRLVVEKNKIGIPPHGPVKTLNQ